MHRISQTSKASSPSHITRTTLSFWGNPLPNPSIDVDLGVLVIASCFLLGCIATSIKLPAPGWAAFLVLVALLWYAVSHRKGGAR